MRRYTFTIVLFIINILLLMKLLSINGYLDSINSSIKQSHIKDSLTIENMKSIISINYLMKIDEVNEFAHIDDSNKIVVYIKEDVCESCLIEILNYISIIDGINFESVLILVNGEGIDKFKYSNIISASIGLKLITYSESLLSYFDCEIITFIVNSDGEIELLFIPEYFPEYKREYFTQILPMYLSKH